MGALSIIDQRVSSLYAGRPNVSIIAVAVGDTIRRHNSYLVCSSDSIGDYCYSSTSTKCGVPACPAILLVSQNAHEMVYKPLLANVSSTAIKIVLPEINR